jgi:uncharacterized membrane protein YfcA
VHEALSLAALNALAADPRFPLAFGIATIAGLVRGFSGFGSALIYIPLISAIYSPRTAAVTLLIVDFVGALWPSIQARKDCDWSSVLPILVAATITAPIGTLLLLVIEPTVLRWFIAVLVLALLGVLLSGWRYRGPQWLSLKLGIGGLAGLSQGATQIGGPLLIVYWLSTARPIVTRANLLLYFQISGIVFIATYLWSGVFDAENVGLIVLLTPPFLIALVIGAFFFRGASDALYRRIAYVIVGIAAIVSLPLFDELLR